MKILHGKRLPMSWRAMEMANDKNRFQSISWRNDKPISNAMRTVLQWHLIGVKMDAFAMWPRQRGGNGVVTVNFITSSFSQIKLQ